MGISNFIEVRSKLVLPNQHLVDEALNAKIDLENTLSTESGYLIFLETILLAP